MLATKRLFVVLLLLVLLSAVATAQISKELTRENCLVLSTPAWKMVFNGERGGELNEVLLFDGDTFRRVNATFAFKSLDTIPALSFASTKDSYYSGKWDVYYANEGRKCRFKILTEAPGEIHFEVSNRPRVMENAKVGPFVVTYTWHVYDVGVVFCDFEVAIPKKDDVFELAWSLMGLHVEDYAFKEKHQGKVSKFVWNWGQLDKTTGAGRWHPPVMSATNAQPLDIDFSRNTQPVLAGFVPYGSAAFNLDHLPGTSYTNAMEIVWETAKPLVGDIGDFGTHFKFRQSGLRPPPTSYGSDRNPPTFSFEWNLYHGKNVDLTGPFRYKNRFGLGFTVQRTRGSKTAHPVMRNRLQGARIYHWVNAGKSGAKWYPSTDDVAKMAAAGADVLILNEGWRRPNTYKPASAGDLKRVIDACHDKGMRVGLTMRGEDYYTLERDTSWFTDVLKRDSDGIYVIHPGFLYSPTNRNAFPVKIKGENLTAVAPNKNHVDAYANFLWSKKLRALVGPNGFLIGETAPLAPTRIGLAYFDAYAPPDIGRLSGTMDRSVLARYRTGNGCVPKAGLGRMARGSRPRAFAAAYGDAPQVLLGAKPGDPVDPDDPQNQAFVNLWKIYRAADVQGASRHDTVSQADKVYTLDTGNVSGTLYRISADEMLLVLANLGPSTDAAVTLDFKKLRMRSGAFNAKVMKISSRDKFSVAEDPLVVTGGRFKTGEMRRFEVAAFHMKRQ